MITDPAHVPPFDRSQAASELVRLSHITHARGWVANHDGNASVRLRQRDRFLITPTAESKADIELGWLIVVDGEGKVVQGRRKPFSELALHLAVYRQRPDVHAVLHAHPPVATAFGLTGVDLMRCTMPEVVVSLGPGVPTVPYALPRSPEWTGHLERFVDAHDAVIMAGNGVLAWGPDPQTALLRMELVEHHARVVHAALQLGPLQELPPSDMAKLLEARHKAGLGPQARRRRP